MLAEKAEKARPKITLKQSWNIFLLSEADMTERELIDERLEDQEQDDNVLSRANELKSILKESIEQAKASKKPMQKAKKKTTKQAKKKAV